MNSFVTSFIRTYVPIVVGAVVSYLVTLGIQLDAETQAGMVVTLTGVSQAVYYAIARFLESKFPKAGVLLGSAKQVVYRENKETK
jgi:hypothetical protein